jgi:hypothetical protein
MGMILSKGGLAIGVLFQLVQNSHTGDNQKPRRPSTAV